MDRKLVIIPTYNEIENIQLILKKIIELENNFHILVVDDSSPDGTAEAVQEVKITYPNQIHLLVRNQKSGLGTAYIAGFQWAIQHQYDYIFEIDADFSHNPKHLNRLLNKAKENFDVVVGSRYIKEGKIKNWPFDRRFLSYGASLYVRLITGMPIKDPTAGFICYKKEVLQTIDFEKISSIGYSFQIEMKYAAWKLGFNITEVPITFIDRVRGTSKMDSSIIKEASIGVLKLSRKSGEYFKK